MKNYKTLDVPKIFWHEIQKHSFNTRSLARIKYNIFTQLKTDGFILNNDQKEELDKISKMFEL